MKKQLLILFISYGILAGCQPAPQQQVLPNRNPEKPILLFILDDKTLSTTNSVWTERNARTAYLSLTGNPGSRIVSISVLSNSNNQQLFLIPVLCPDTIPVTSDNIFQKSRLIQSNQQKMSLFTAAVDSDLKKLSDLLCQKKTCTQSDVNAALSLLGTTCREKIYANYTIIVLVTSDLMISMPGNESLHAVILPKEARLLIVRPGISTETLKCVFPNNNNIEIYSNIDDAVSSISFHNN